MKLKLAAFLWSLLTYIQVSKSIVFIKHTLHTARLTEVPNKSTKIIIQIHFINTIKYVKTKYKTVNNSKTSNITSTGWHKDGWTDTHTHTLLSCCNARNIPLGINKVSTTTSKHRKVCCNDVCQLSDEKAVVLFHTISK